ncbi:YheT family hydrolase [Pontibacter toksunensis]|uniref:YheT family hydrolase n=1 Tax=Pontibacter toksunensis TaxID=1332631 RepID=A0ABW6C011_9BACT
MPVNHSKARIPYYLFNGHIQTIYSWALRRISYIHYERERVTTQDDDFLDLDWSRVGGRNLAVLCHGLEGSTNSAYMKGMTRALNAHYIDVLGWNYRGCSGEANKLLKSYHAGSTDDLSFVINYVLKENPYQILYLIGFSLGGNLVLKYLGEAPSKVPKEIKKATVFSVPCHIKSAAKQMTLPYNAFYQRRFINSMVGKIKLKSTLFSGSLDLTNCDKLKTFKEFDNRYTAPLHGFHDADEYYEKCSSKQFLNNIQVPTLCVNALNDSFLSNECYPFIEAVNNPYLILEVPLSGGHLGFVEGVRNNSSYVERRTIEFVHNNEY